MAASSFDSTHAVRFDLPKGSVRTRGDDDRVVLVPSAALEELVRGSTAEAAEAFSRALGAAIGRRAAARMGDPHSASVEDFMAQLGGEAAVAGVGVWSIERWGRALVFVVEDSPLAAGLLAPLISSALEASSGRRAWCVVLSHEERAARVLVAGQQSVARVRDWLASGTRWGEVLVKLHGEGP
jgi:hypothetical protein